MDSRTWRVYSPTLTYIHDYWKNPRRPVQWEETAHEPISPGKQKKNGHQAHTENPGLRPGPGMAPTGGGEVNQRSIDFQLSLSASLCSEHLGSLQ